MKKHTKNIKEESVLEEHLRFEEFLGVLSAKLVNLPLEYIDLAINETIKLLAEFFNADRCHVGKLNSEDDSIVTIYFYAKPNITTPLVPSIGTKYFQFVHSSIKGGNTISFKNPEELPKEAESDKNNFINQLRLIISTPQ